MKAIRIDHHGGPEVLALVTVDDPTPDRDEVLVRVAAAGVNFIDTYQRAGVYAMQTPFVAGQEGAGEVVSVGADVRDVAVGAHVAWNGVLGSYAEFVRVPAAQAVPVPAALSDEIAAALMLQGLTAHYLCHSTYPVQAGDWVLVHAAAGGVGRLLTQLVRNRGGHVVATAGGPAKCALAASAGAEVVVDYHRDDFVAAVATATGGLGVAAAFDGVGQDTFDGSLATLRRRGMLVLFGASSGQVPPFTIQRLNSGGSVFLTRPTMADYVATRAELLARADAVFAAAADGSLDVRIGHRYPLADARLAHEDLEGRRTTGKLLLAP